jgi:hypothetical protein
MVHVNSLAGADRREASSRGYAIGELRRFLKQIIHRPAPRRDRPVPAVEFQTGNTASTEIFFYDSHVMCGGQGTRKIRAANFWGSPLMLRDTRAMARSSA